MPSWRQGDFLLCKRLDLIPNYIDSSVASSNEVHNLMLILRTHRSSEAFNSNTPSLYASPSN